MTGILRVAVPIEEDKGMRSKIAPIFAKAPYFTIIELKDNKIVKKWTEANEAASLTQGTGPITAINLTNKGVNVVAATKLGPGITSILKDKNIKIKFFKENTKISRIVEAFYKQQIVA